MDQFEKQEAYYCLKQLLVHNEHELIMNAAQTVVFPGCDINNKGWLLKTIEWTKTSKNYFQ